MQTLSSATILILCKEKSFKPFQISCSRLNKLSLETFQHSGKVGEKGLPGLRGRKGAEGSRGITGSIIYLCYIKGLSIIYSFLFYIS